MLRGEGDVVNRLTYTVHITLHTPGEIIVDDLSDASEIHTTCHHFRADHYPTLSSTHSADRIIALLFGHPGMKTVDVWNPVQDKFFSK
jgi:hypothetical protein